MHSLYIKTRIVMEQHPIKINKVQIRNLQIEDYVQLSQSFTRVYSDGSDVFWTREQIQKLIKIFPEGQIVTVVDDKIVGCALSIIVDYDKVKKERYTSTWVDIDMEAMRRTEENKDDDIGPWICFTSSVPSKRIAGDFRTIEHNEENAVEVENVNKCVIEAKITYTDGKEETQYLIMETESKYIVTAVNVYKVNIK